jgi:4-hydroxy-tetrahydrodipicolinate synthase
MTDFFIESGVDGITVLGQLGEAPKMTHRESVGIVSRVAKRVNVPIIVGVSAPASRRCASSRRTRWRRALPA